MKRINSKERGFASIVALFLLVVMAAMGSFMLTFSNTQQLASAQDIKGSQAYWAARAGLEWGMGYVIRQPAGTVECADLPDESTGFDGVFTEELTGFDGGFTVEVTCKKSVYTEGVKNIKIFSITSVANNNPAMPGNVGFIERSVSASIEK
jgi:MSHA biogenesis protein MshP|tara:strand:+ start:3623 stop:4075 length:453 start_codon:yes stop_codon:yes gene_type:complete